jgi:LysR family glycine cleavage system transcriptional activator
MVALFAGPRLPLRSYCSYLPDGKSTDDFVLLFPAWIEREGRRSNAETSI